MARARRCWVSAKVRQLKRVKKILVLFSFADLEWITDKIQVIEYQGY